MMELIEKFDGRLRRRWEKYRYLSTDILTLDIETTSCYINGDGIIPYERGHDAEYWNSLTPIAIPYIFMFSVNERVYYGRNFSDFRFVLDVIKRRGTNCIIWVHNLSFEFQFLSNFFEWKSVFARSPHKVMKCVPKDYPNVEFRCSYFLTRLSLENWGKQIGYHKKSGDLDYNVIRTPLTPLTDTEMGYCEADCLVIYHGIKHYLKKYGTQENIPLTQTGTVRRDVRNIMMGYPELMGKIQELIPETASQYKMLQGLFAGGYTHANRMYAGHIIKGKVSHYDFASSYPFCMLAEKYPSTPWLELFNVRYKDIENHNWEDYAYIYHLKFERVQCTTFNTYLQASKIEFNECTSNLEIDNGRVLECDHFSVWLTERDLDIIQKTYWYDAETVVVLDCYVSKKEYLPRPFLEYLLELYENKTRLKGVDGMESIYLQSKEYINSLYGMMVTALVQSDVEVDSDLNWSMDQLTAQEVESALTELRTDENSKTFLSYSWGIYVTAYARHNLWDCILQYDDRVIYADTDSIFLVGDGDFTFYNNGVMEKLNAVCRTLKLDISKTSPRDPKGNYHTIGIFERENDCIEFITLGAKRYCLRDAKDKKLHITISGINKGAVECLNDDIANFRDGFNFDKDAPGVKKMLSVYCTDMPEVEFSDGYISKNRFGLLLRPTGYKLELTDAYKNLIDYCDGKVVTSDAWEVSKRGRFA